MARAERGGGKAAFDRAKEALCEDVFSSGVWSLLSNLEDPELRWLAKALPATVLKFYHKEIYWSLSEVEDMGRGQTGGPMLSCAGDPFGAVLAAPE